MQNTRYRVVGIRRDGTRRILADNLLLTVAEDVKAAIAAGIFDDVIIEPDTDLADPEHP